MMQVRNVIVSLLQKIAPTMHKTRREALGVIVKSALKSAKLVVTELGRSIDSQAKEKHCIKRADRLLSNQHLHEERVSVYANLAKELVGSRTRPVILIDGSDLDEHKGHFLLRASLPVQGRALTLYEEVYTEETKEKPATHLAFLNQLKALLPAGCQPILVTDAGFRTPWFKQVETLGWDWVGRIRNRHEIKLAGKDEWLPCQHWHAQATGTPTALGHAQLTKSNPIDCELVLYKSRPQGRIALNRLGRRSCSSHSLKHEQANREPWLLGTSLPVRFRFAKKIVTLYALRMQIEESFRDTKSTRFGLGLERHRTYQLKRLQILLLIGSLALLVAWLIGKATELTGQARHWQANTERRRVVLSTVFLGLKVVDDPRLNLTPSDLIEAVQTLYGIIQRHGALVPYDA